LAKQKLWLLIKECAFRENSLLDVLEEAPVCIELFEIRGNPS